MYVDVICYVIKKNMKCVAREIERRKRRNARRLFESPVSVVGSNRTCKTLTRLWSRKLLGRLDRDVITGTFGETKFLFRLATLSVPCAHKVLQHRELADRASTSATLSAKLQPPTHPSTTLPPECALEAHGAPTASTVERSLTPTQKD